MGRAWILFAALLTAIPAAAQTDPVTVTAKLSNTAAPPGGQVALTTTLTIAEPYHIQPQKPDDPDLIATYVRLLDLPPGVTWTAVYPKPKPYEIDFGAGKQTLLFLGGAVEVQSTLFVHPNVKPGPITFRVAVTYQACDESTCLPPTDQVRELTLTVSGDAAGPVTRPDESADVVAVRHAFSAPAAKPGQTILLAVVLDIAEHYHLAPDKAQVPAKDAEFTIPTELSLVPAAKKPRGVAVQPARYPKAAMLDGGPTIGQVPGFGGRTVLHVPIAVAEDAKPGEVDIPLQLHSQACDDKGTCLAIDSVIYFTPRLRIVAADAQVGPAEEPDLFANVTDAPITPPRIAPRIPTAAPEQGTTAADASASQSTAAALPAGPLRFDAFGIGFSLDPSTAGGFAMLLLAAAFGGALLNLTPCVLPVIPLKIMGLSHAAGSRARTLLLGIVMSCGVVAFWLVLGGLVAGLSEFDGPSQLFAYPQFTIGVGVFIAIMAVGMCGLFSVRLPTVVYAVNPKLDSLHGSFLFGVMTAVLSTPCTAPFMGTALGWSAAAGQPASTTMLVFAAIGAGMAAPYLILSAYPQLANRVPRTGPANELLKQVMGLGMLAAAAYFIGVGIVSLTAEQGQPPSQFYWAPVFALLAAAGFWLAWRIARIQHWPIGPMIFTAIGLLLFAFSIREVASVLLPAGNDGATVAGSLTRGSNGNGSSGVGVGSTHIDWVYYTPERFEEAMSSGRVVVVDFTAEWCLNCKVLERNVLHTAAVAGAIREADAIAMKVDLTVRDEDLPTWQYLRREGATGPPLLVIYAPDGRQVFKSNAYRIGQVIAAVREAQTVAAASSNP